MIEVSSQVTSQQPRLRVRNQSDRDLLIEEPMRDFLSFPLLVGRQHGLPPVVAEPHGAAWPLDEVAWLQLAPVDQRERQPIGDGRSQLLHQIERQRRSTRASVCK